MDAALSSAALQQQGEQQYKSAMQAKKGRSGSAEEDNAREH